MKLRILAPVILVVMLSASASASFAVVPYDNDVKMITPERDFRVGLLNTGDKPLEITISAESGKGYGVNFLDEKEFTLQPSGDVGQPGGDWYYTGEEYVRITEKKFRVTVYSNRTQDRIKFPLTVEARAGNQGKGPDMEFIREVPYTISIYELMQGAGNDFNGDEKNNDVRFWDENSQEKETGEEPRNTENPENEAQSDPDENNTERSGNDGGANTVTLILVLGISAMLLYMYRAI